jgi:hypothetical protein
LTAWKQITTREALYTEIGQLGGWWAAELRNNPNEHNSAYLTSLLDESDRLVEVKKQAELARQLEQNRVAEQARSADVRIKQAAHQEVRDSACVSTATTHLPDEPTSRRGSDVQDAPRQSTGVLADRFEALELGMPLSSLISEVEEVKSPRMIKRFMSAVKNASTNKLVKLRRSTRIESVGEEAKRGVTDPLESSEDRAAQLPSKDITLSEPNISHLPTPSVSPVRRKAVPLADTGSMLAQKAHAEKPPGYSSIAPGKASPQNSDHESDAILQAFFEFFGMLDLAQQANLHDPPAADAAKANTSTSSAAPAVSAVPV